MNPEYRSTTKDATQKPVKNMHAITNLINSLCIQKLTYQGIQISCSTVASQTLRLTILLSFSTLLSGCMFTYLVKSAKEQVSIIANREPIYKILEDPKTDSATKAKLKLALQVTDFAKIELGLDVGGNYQKFVDLNRPYVSYLLRVAEAKELKSYIWSYPIVGDLPYKGFFDKADAIKEEKLFIEKGYDTYIRGVTAYSTLGWMDDPVLSSMIRYSDYDFVELLIHENVHRTLFIKGHAEFNERLASFLGKVGAELYFKKVEGPNSPTLLKEAQFLNDQEIFGEFITKELKDLTLWYDNHPQHSASDKTNRLEQIIKNFTSIVKPKLKSKNFDYFAKLELNNARLLPYQTYIQDLQAFDEVFKKHGSDFKIFLKKMKGLEKSKKPAEDIKTI